MKSFANGSFISLLWCVYVGKSLGFFFMMMMGMRMMMMMMAENVDVLEK